MFISRQRALSYVNEEWRTYIERFNRLSKEEQNERVKKQGYEEFRDVLAHILEGWIEGMSIICAVVEGRSFERRKYDFATALPVNAEAVAKYKSWEEAGFLAYFEETRQKMGADLRSMDEAAFENLENPGLAGGGDPASCAPASRRLELLSGRRSVGK